MIKAIDKKYCVDNLVQLMPYTDVCHLIVSADEIILLKTEKGVIINKYAQHPSRHLFPFSENVQNDFEHFTELFEYNKVYLDFRGSVGGFRFDKYYFFKGSERALFLDETLSVDERNATMDSVELSRTEIEKIFDSANYDSMYVIDRNGRILLAKNANDKICIGKSIIPSDDEIIEKELCDRKGNYNIARALNPSNNIHENYKKANVKKTIEEIENFKIYGPALFGKYSDLLLTVKDGKFDLKWFRIDFIGKDKFKLTTSPIAIIEPTIDDVIDYSNNYDIEYTHDPIQRTSNMNSASEQQVEITEEINVDRETLLQGRTHRMSAAEIAKKEIEEKLGIPYEQYEELDIEEQRKLIEQKTGKKFKYDTRLHIDGIPIDEDHIITRDQINRKIAGIKSESKKLLKKIFKKTK